MLKKMSSASQQCVTDGGVVMALLAKMDYYQRRTSAQFLVYGVKKAEEHSVLFYHFVV